MTVCIGLTGGIGSGKSTVAALLAARGAHVLDADAASRASTAAGGRAMADIRRVFGPDFIAADGSMDRARMREHVFAQPEAKAQLEAIVHPHVQASLQAQLAQVTSGWAVFDLPLLVESGHWRARMHQVLVIDCDPQTQIQRVMARNAWTREAVERVMAAQATRLQRLACADAVIFNGAGTSLELLHTSVNRFSEQVMQTFGL